MENKILNIDTSMKKIDFKVIPITEIEDLSFKIYVDFEINEIDDNRAMILAYVKAEFEPAVMFKSNAIFSIKVKFENSVKEEYIIKNIEEILYPISSEISYLMSVLSKSVDGTAFIVPPIINRIRLKKDNLKV